MIFHSHVSIELEWKYLPWLQINKRITLMQRKIFDASKKYDLNRLYKAQNILINSFEARIFAIEKIIKDINQYYKYSSYENYLFNDIDKFYIFKYLFNHNSPLKARLKILVEQIKEYLIYLLLRPEWKARFNVLNHQYLEKKYLVYYNNIENLDWDKLIRNNRLLSHTYECIHHWSINKYYLNNCYYKFTYLPNLLLDISKQKFNWFILKIKKSKYNSNCGYINFKHSEKILKNSLNNICNYTKSKFYYQNYLKKIKFKQQLSWQIIANEINLIVQQELSKNIKELNYYFILYIINQINNLLSLFKIKQKYNHFIYLLNYYKSNMYNILYKKIISIYLYRNSFQINR